MIICGILNEYCFLNYHGWAYCAKKTLLSILSNLKYGSNNKVPGLVCNTADTMFFCNKIFGLLQKSITLNAEGFNHFFFTSV